ncbi:MAG: (Fe-S)-binding protein [Candidatus Helarchaeales archaeon]
MSHVSSFQIYKLLPKTNCKKCGEATCMAFATKLLNRLQDLENCTPLYEDPKYERNLAELKEILAPLFHAEVHPSGVTLDVDLCTGCGNCVTACPPNVRAVPSCGQGIGPNSDHVIFKVVDGKVKILKLDRCRRYEPPKTACRICETFCYSRAIEIVGT